MTLPMSASEALINYPWPGNIRELNNVIQSAYALTDGTELNMDAFRAACKTEKHQTARAPGQTLAQMVSGFETEIITDALSVCGMNLSATAERLGIPRSSLYNKLKRYQIDTELWQRRTDGKPF